MLLPDWQPPKKIDEVRMGGTRTDREVIIYFEDGSTAWWVPRDMIPDMKKIVGGWNDPDYFFVPVKGRDVLIMRGVPNEQWVATWFDGKVEHEVRAVASVDELIRLAASMMP